MTDRIVEGFRELLTANVADVLRCMAYPAQVVDSAILALKDDWKVCGRAFTLENLPARSGERNIYHGAPPDYSPGDVVVHSYWSTCGTVHISAAKMKGAVGFVIDGSYRDIPEHLRLFPDFPVFCRRGLSERSSNPGASHPSFLTQWVHAYNVPINCGGVRVEAGDIIVGDADGVVVVPREIEEDVLKFAISYQEMDNGLVRANLEGDPKAIEEAWARENRWQKESGILDWLAEHGIPAFLGSWYER